MENICLDLNNLIPRLLRFGIWVTRNFFMIYLKYQMMGQVLQPRFFFKKSFQERKKKRGKTFARRSFLSWYTYFSTVFPTPAPLYNLAMWIWIVLVCVECGKDRKVQHLNLGPYKLLAQTFLCELIMDWRFNLLHYLGVCPLTSTILIDTLIIHATLA